MSPKRQHLGLYVRFQPHDGRNGHVAECLRALWRHWRGPVIRRWGQGSMPRGAARAAVQQASPRRPLEAFPAYAPELNPSAQLWNAWKRPTANRLRPDTRALRRRLHAHTRRGRRAQETLRAFIHASTLPSPP